MGFAIYQSFTLAIDNFVRYCLQVFLSFYFMINFVCMNFFFLQRRERPGQGLERAREKEAQKLAAGSAAAAGPVAAAGPPPPAAQPQPLALPSPPAVSSPVGAARLKWMSEW